MTKLTDNERKALNNACARLRETNLGTKIGNIEDFIDINILKTDADTLSTAINELFDKWANPLLNVTIPPPGFFTLAGDSEGNLWCYCNDETNPPVFEHNENTGDLYLNIASEDGVNSYKVHVGNYIAVKHLQDYYTKNEINSKISTIETELSTKSDNNHNHDDRYYTESEIDAKEAALQSAIDSLVGFSANVVSSLPEVGEEGIMYLVLSESGIEQDIYNEYIWVNNNFEKIGNTAVEVDLSGYATINFVNSVLANYVSNSELTTQLSNKANSSHTHDDRYYTEAEINTKLNAKAGTNVATTSTNGLMSSADKTKLNNISEGANKTTVDSSLSTTSTNPVQNKIINTALTKKSNTGHTHGVSLGKTSLASNFFCTEFGNIAIISWWSTSLNVSTANSWQTLHTLPVTNLGKCVWTTNIKNGSGVVYLRVNENSSSLQYFSDATGNVAITAGQLICFIGG